MQIPPKIGDYDIINVVARTQMSIVYKAFQPSLNRFVALKVPLPEYAQDEEYIKHFLYEARIAAQLNHPNIVQIYGVSDVAPYYIAMTFIEGETLMARIRREHKLDPSQAVQILDQVAEALDYAHSRGVIHRDIKPANIMLDHSDNAYLMDFGIAHAADQTLATRTGKLFGTPAYMSPERFQGGEIKGTSDIYSLGIVAYEMLSGQVPFRADSSAGITHQHVNNPPPPLRITPAVNRVIQKALAKKPAERYTSAGRFARDLYAAVFGASRQPRPWLYAIPLVISIIAILVTISVVGFSFVGKSFIDAIGQALFPTGTATTTATLPTSPTPRIIVETVIVTATPPATYTPTSTYTPVPTLTATPTATRVVVAPPAPTPTPTPTSTNIPTPQPRGVWVTNMVVMPTHTSDSGSINFNVSFLNTTSETFYYSWCAEVFVKGDLSRSHGITPCQSSTIPPGAKDLWAGSYSTHCGSYQVRPIWIDQFFVRRAFTNPDGSPVWGEFSVCP